MAAQRIAGIGRIGDDTTGAHDLGRTRDEARGRVRGIDLEVLRHGNAAWRSRFAARASPVLRRGSRLPSPVVPDRLQIARQRRQLAEIDQALVGAVEIGAARREESELPREARELGVLGLGVAAGDDLDALAARALELVEELPQLGARELVAAWMCDDGATTARAD